MFVYLFTCLSFSFVCLVFCFSVWLSVCLYSVYLPVFLLVCCSICFVIYFFVCLFGSLSVCLSSVCLSVCLFICLPACLCFSLVCFVICLPACLFVFFSWLLSFLFRCLVVCLSSFCPFVCLFVFWSVNLSVCLSVCLFVFLSVCLPPCSDFVPWLSGKFWKQKTSAGSLPTSDGVFSANQTMWWQIHTLILASWNSDREHLFRPEWAAGECVSESYRWSGGRISLEYKQRPSELDSHLKLDLGATWGYSQKRGGAVPRGMLRAVPHVGSHVFYCVVLHSNLSEPLCTAVKNKTLNNLILIKVFTQSWNSFTGVTFFEPRVCNRK